MRGMTSALHLTERLTDWFTDLLGDERVAGLMAAWCVEDGDRYVAGRLGHAPGSKDRYVYRLAYSPQKWLIKHSMLTKALLEQGVAWRRAMRDQPDADPDETWDRVLDQRVNASIVKGNRQHPSCPYSDGHTFARPHVRGVSGRVRFEQALEDARAMWGMLLVEPVTDMVVPDFADRIDAGRRVCPVFS